jgi:hypothetical protein
LTLVGALLRLLPHLPNLVPVGGLSLFAGARLRGWQAYAIPVIIILVTDPIMGIIFGYPAYTLVTPFVCGSFLIYVWIGCHLRTTENPWRIGGAAVLGSGQFFLITNFGVWLSGISIYPLTPSGLMACYLGGIPYLGRTLVSDLAYSGVLFGLHAWLTRTALPQERVREHAEVVLL